MFDVIDSIRQKSDRVKRRLAFFLAFFFSGVILVVWITIIFPDFRQSQEKKTEVSKNIPSPTSAFGNTFSDGISQIGEQLARIKETMSVFGTTEVYYSATGTIPTEVEAQAPDLGTTTDKTNDQISE